MHVYLAALWVGEVIELTLYGVSAFVFPVVGIKTEAKVDELGVTFMQLSDNDSRRTLEVDVGRTQLTGEVPRGGSLWQVAVKE